MSVRARYAWCGSCRARTPGKLKRFLLKEEVEGRR